MLQIKHVSKTFNKGTVNEKQALRDLNLTLKEGDFEPLSAVMVPASLLC